MRKKIEKYMEEDGDKINNIKKISKFIIFLNNYKFLVIHFLKIL